MHYTCTCGKHKPVGLVAESPSLLLSASVDSEEDGKAVASFASIERETFYYVAECIIWMPALPELIKEIGTTTE